MNNTVKKSSIDLLDTFIILYLSTLFLLYDIYRPIVEIIAICGILLTLPSHEIRINRYAAWGILFAGFCFCSTIWSGKMDLSLVATRGVVECVICGVVIQIYLETEKEYNKIIQYCTVLCYFMTLKILITVPINQILNRQFSGLLNANSIGVRFSVCFVLSLWYIKKEHKHVANIMRLLPMVFFAIMTGSKKAIVIILIGVIILQILYAKNALSSTLYVIGGAILVYLSIYLMMNNDFLYSVIGYRIDGVLKGLQYGFNYADASTRERMMLIRYATETWVEKPILGHGINTFASTVGYTGYGDHALYTHVNYLELLYGVGILGTLIFYSIHFANVIVLKGQPNRDLRIIVICCSVIILFIDSAMVSYGDEFVHFLLALTCSASFCKDISGDDMQ